LITEIIQISIYAAAPAIIQFGCKKFQPFNWLGPVVICYALGISMANLFPVLIKEEIAEQTYSIAVPLSILLLLFSSDLQNLRVVSKNVILSFLFCVLAACLSGIFNFILFKNKIENSEAIIGMLVGIFTGGTPNMAAVAHALMVNSSTVALINVYEVIVGGIYLFFLMSFAFRTYNYILPALPSTDFKSDEKKETPNSVMSHTLFEKTKSISLSVFIALLLLGAAIITSILIWGNLNGTFIIAAITLLGIVASFSKKIKSIPYSFETGEYILLIFAVAIGSLCNFSIIQNQFDAAFLLVISMLTGCVLIHLLFCLLFRIDKTTTIITSTAAIMSPPFVPAVAKSIGNKSLILPGLTVGILGNAIGSLLGIAVARLLYFI
jgi:uncharacterized membrane protein